MWLAEERKGEGSRGGGPTFLSAATFFKPATTALLKAVLASRLRVKAAAASTMSWKNAELKPAKREAVTSMPLRLMPGTLSTWVSSDMRLS